MENRSNFRYSSQAWTYLENIEEQFVVVLHVDPVNSPQKAVQAAIASQESEMISTKVIILNKDDILGSVILALATRSSGQQIASGMTKDYLKLNGFFILNFRYKYQIDRFRGLVKEYVPKHMQSQIEIKPNSI